MDDLEKEFSDRFGTPPPEVRNLLYAVRIKALAAKAGIESISTEDKQIVLRLFEGMTFDRQKLEPFHRGGIKVGLHQLRINYRQLSNIWQRLLEEVLGRVMK